MVEVKGLSLCVKVQSRAAKEIQSNIMGNYFYILVFATLAEPIFFCVKLINLGQCFLFCSLGTHRQPTFLLPPNREQKHGPRIGLGSTFLSSQDMFLKYDSMSLKM